MPLPYENTTSGEKAYLEIEKILSQFGCSKFGRMNEFETGQVILQFEWQGHRAEIRASAHGYASAWLKEHPFTYRTRGSEKDYKAKALKKGQMAVPSILRDWIKGQVTAIETGLLTFEDVFMPHMLLPNGQRFVEAA
ncbi:MAG: hypothetical protein MJA29_07495, partial [Candidatus Omnitrophica bacterium]|nr:hypothetical protein [Candidatus Omnitrophota bacterium]